MNCATLKSPSSQPFAPLLPCAIIDSTFHVCSPVFSSSANPNS
ncbi:Uncharacterised protein [Vibrio cholerae]|nr:Uncharacterised protein [Vibrio cholerae]